MNLKILAVHDAAVGQFDRPFTARSIAEAERMILAAVREKDSHMAKHASDMSLYIVGEFESDNGYVVPLDPQCVVTSAALVAHQRQSEKHLED